MIVSAAAILFQLSAALPAAKPSEVAALVARARSARLQQDSLLAGYEAIARQRISAHIGLTGGGVTGTVLGTVAANRLAGRFESVARVGWRYDLGAWGEIIAGRSVLPFIGGVTPRAENDEGALVLPYYPGRDRLWPTGEMRNALPALGEWIDHPLSAGADSVYEFSTGDSLRIRLPDQQVIRLREIRVRPRRPASRLMVGSLWVDIVTGNLVRAAYRPSVAMDLWPFIEREVDRNDRDMVKKFGPFTGIIREIIIDHGLYQGRFWLPKTRIATAEGTATGGRITISIEQTFEYSRVTALEPAAVRVTADTISGPDHRLVLRLPNGRGFDVRRGPCRAKGDTASERWSADSVARNTGLSVMTSDGARMRVLLPCDPEDLVTSPALPASIYSTGEELFPATDFAALRKDAEDALSISKQARWNPQPVMFYYGIDRGMLRYNRVEGLSAGIMADRVLGEGYTAGGLARIGVADHQPLAEVFVQRDNVVDAVRATAYRRLAVANDWGNPLGLGASISAVMFGRDDGFYYRTLGAELTGTHHSAGDALIVSWRVFGERQATALVETNVSLAHATSGTPFVPNIIARTGQFAGGAVAAGYTWGLDPRGLRVTGNTRFESATGESSYGRAMTELTLIRGLGGSYQVTFTGAAGSSVGSLPAQRSWYLGGPYTVHGHAADAASGNAFWLGRAELTAGNPLVRPIVFADVGWAGTRDDFVHARQTISGAGAGASMIDGLLRLDLSRDLRGAGRWRADLYFEIR